MHAGHVQRGELCRPGPPNPSPILTLALTLIRCTAATGRQASTRTRAPPQTGSPSMRTTTCSRTTWAACARDPRTCEPSKSRRIVRPSHDDTSPGDDASILRDILSSGAGWRCRVAVGVRAPPNSQLEPHIVAAACIRLLCAHTVRGQCKTRCGALRSSSLDRTRTALRARPPHKQLCSHTRYTRGE